jgi:hypothetical protein
MKIFIANLNLECLKDISELLKEYLIHSENYIELYTNEGIYNIEDKKCYELDVIDKDIKTYNNYYKDFGLIVDYSYFNKKPITSVKGDKHESLFITKKVYKLNKISSFEIVIKFCTENNIVIPHDIYLYSKNDIDVNNILTKNEIIEFLSVLN